MEKFTMHQVNENIMRRLVGDVINNKLYAVIDEIIHPDYVYRTPNHKLHGKQALRELFTSYHAAFPNLHVDIEDIVCTDNKAVLMFKLTGTQKNELMGIPATGKEVNINGMICSQIENGQIIKEWELLDQLSMLQQLGVVSV
jgi:steroid delta-isomerase-like uncharacterized protein